MLFATLRRHGALLLATLSLSSPAWAQMTCGDAVAQLQVYVVQVNTVANAEYHQGITVRCNGNPFCMQQLLAQLNAWYMQQAQMVNAWYVQLAQQCANQQLTGIASSPPTRNEPGRLDEGAVGALEVDDEDRTVRIRIPSTPAGYL